MDIQILRSCRFSGVDYSSGLYTAALGNAYSDVTAAMLVAQGVALLLSGSTHLVPLQGITDAGGNIIAAAGFSLSNNPLRAMIFGNSVAKQSQYINDSSTPRFQGNSFIRRFNSLMQGTFEFDSTGDSTIGGQALLQGVWGYSGQTSTTILPSLAPCIAACQPGVVFLHLFENDLVAPLLLAESYANLKTAIQTCKNAGALPVVFCCLPSLSYVTTTHRDYYGQLNDLIFSYCASVGGAIPIDVSAYIDTANTYPQPLALYTDASVHPTEKGNALLGQWVYDQINNRFQKRKARSYGKMDGNALLSVIPNPAMSGTAGTNGTNSSGPVADSWSASATSVAGTSAVVCSKVADGTKFSQKLSATYSGVASSSGDGFSLFCAAASTGYSIGDMIYIEAEVEITGSPAALKSIFGYVLAAGTGDNLSTDGYQASATVGISGVYPVGRFVLRSPVYTLQASITSLRPFVTAKWDTGSTAANADLIVHSAIIRKVPFAQA